MPPQVWQKNHRLIAARNDLRRARVLLRDAAAVLNDDPGNANPIAAKQYRLAGRITKFLDKSRGRK